MNDEDKARLRKKVKKQFFNLLTDMLERELDDRVPSGDLREFDIDYAVEQFIDRLRAKWFP